MAVYGIGAMYDGTNDQTEIFIKWVSRVSAGRPTTHRLFTHR